MNRLRLWWMRTAFNLFPCYRRTGARITAIARESIGTGQVGRCVRFHCRFADPVVDSGDESRAEVPSSFVGKFPSEDPRSLQAAKDHRTYLLEVGFYRELQQSVAVRTPRCFHHAISSDAARFVLLLEDLRGARQGDQLAGCPVEQASAALRELQTYVLSGLTPYQALETGTRNVARYFRAENEFGTVAQGRRADLILLDANPLADIANMSRQAGVMVRGRWLPREEIERRLAS